MPKSMYVDPQKMREAGEIAFNNIPVNQYNKKISDESYTKKEILRIFYDMSVIREFETMLMEVKTKGMYAGKEFTYPGPAHLSIGQEAAAVGQSYLLGLDDFIFGSHRSHGEVLAKGLSAIELMKDAELLKIMQDFFDGAILKLIEGKQKTNAVKDLAKDFLIFGTMAEIFARNCGFNRGMGGSMHVFFLPFGIYPNNAIVGGSAPIATGSALFKKVNRKKGIIVANSGDGSLGCGPVWESLNFASMDQYSKLWGEDFKGGLPIIFNFNNNHYGMGGQTAGETMAYEMLARVGAGISPTQLHAERIDGHNPLAVIDAYRRKLDILRENGGPVLLDVVTYRISGHSTSDASSYRTKEEMDAWMQVDPLNTLRADAVAAKIASDSDFENVLNNVRERMHKLFMTASDESICPLTDFDKNPAFLENVMFSNQRVESMDDRTPDVLQTKEETHTKRLEGKVRFHVDSEGKAVPKSRQYAIRDGIFEAILDKYHTDPTLISYGEDVRDWGGAFAAYRGLTEAIPYHRLFNSPISEAAIIGSAVGYGLSGGRAIVELMYCDFIGRAGDEIFNQMSKWQAMSAGILKMPVVLRVSVGAKYAAQHSQDWTSLVAHIPGLKAVFPVTPYDAKGLMNSALMGTDPVVFFESQRIYDIGEMFYKDGVPEGYYEIPLGEPDIKKQGSDITILTIGATLYRALDAAKILEEKYGMSAEVIDARSIVPFNYEPVLESVKKTGKILLASDACARGSILNDFASNITEMAFDYLDAPPVIVGAKNWITPPFEYDKYFFPQPEWFIDAIHEKIIPLEGHIVTPNTNYTNIEKLRISRKGV